jgi:hypothetical protein
MMALVGRQGGMMKLNGPNLAFGLVFLFFL